MTIDMDAARETIRPLIEALTARRHDLGLTQRQLAEHTNGRQSEIGAWETLRMVPTVLSLVEWATALGYELVLMPLEDGDA